jgi:hypothetical protein
MTNRFASRGGGSAAAAILACTLAVSADAQGSRPVTAAPENVVLFFDVQSPYLSPEARKVVLGAVDSAERAHAGRIELAAYAAPDETARDPALAARRAATVKEQIANYGFQGLVIVDDEASDPPLTAIANDTFHRMAILRVSD